MAARVLFAADDLLVRHIACDGVDPARPSDEGIEGARIILVATGRFVFEDRGGRRVASPAAGLFLPDGHAYRIRHVDGGDTCVAIQGALGRLLVAEGPVCRPMPVGSYACMRELAARLAAGECFTRLEVEENIASAFMRDDRSEDRVTTRDRSVAAAIAYVLERDMDARVPLAELATSAGVSLFHACRVFKRVMGVSIHRYQQEVRLRHALAWLLESNHPISRIAADAGFASQAHLTNLFRRRFGATPGRVRKRGLRGLHG